MEGEDTEKLDAVMVVRRLDDEGNVSIEVRPVGDMRYTEVDTVLALGRLRWQGQIGIG